MVTVGTWIRFEGPVLLLPQPPFAFRALTPSGNFWEESFVPPSLLLLVFTLEINFEISQLGQCLLSPRHFPYCYRKQGERGNWELAVTEGWIPAILSGDALAPKCPIDCGNGAGREILPFSQPASFGCEISLEFTPQKNIVVSISIICSPCRSNQHNTSE